jgi:hypothetical protein
MQSSELKNLLKEHKPPAIVPNVSEWGRQLLSLNVLTVQISTSLIWDVQKLKN